MNNAPPGREAGAAIDGADRRLIPPRKKQLAALHHVRCICTPYTMFASAHASAPTALSVLALFLVAVTMGLSLAHALEFPGKLRLDEPTYRAIQSVYYPGFTFGGLVGEFGSLVVLVVLLFLTPTDTGPFVWTALALGSLIVGHGVYWFVTHPVNSAWLKNTQLTGASRFFFRLFGAPDSDWKHMRAIWEWSHVARAGFATVGFLCMALAVTR